MKKFNSINFHKILLFIGHPHNLGLDYVLFTITFIYL